MNPGSASANIQCPACKQPVTVPASLRATGRGTAEVSFDLSPVHAHIEEHTAREESQRGHP